MDLIKRPERCVKLVTAAELASVLQVSRAFVYERQAFFGAIRLGDGPKAPLRFDLDAVLDRIACQGSEPEAASNRVVEPLSARRRRRQVGSVELLPVKGSGAA
jgi:hypothetical protein